MSKLNTVLEANPTAFNKNVGVSDSAGEIRRDTENIRYYFAGSVTFGEHLAKVLEDLLKEREEHSVDNWDGYGAKAVNIDSFYNACHFALSIPSNVPTPEIYVDTDGEITFEWYKGRRQVFSISVGSKSELAYAGLFGASKTYGVEQFYDDVPERLLDNINRLYQD